MEKIKKEEKSVDEIFRHIDEICEKLFQLDLLQKDTTSWIKEQKRRLEVELRKTEIALDEICLEIDFSTAQSLSEKRKEAF